MLFDILNRLGIVLNFLAGFMLAPQLLGEDRIKRLEIKIDRNARNNIENLKKWIGNNYFICHILAFWFTPGTLKYHYFNFFCICISYISLITAFFYKPNGHYQIIFTIALICSIIQTFISYYSLPVVLIDIIGRIEDLLDSDDTVVTILSFGGIVFFIAGNLFQFIATFKPN
jgi:hypothetical protein